jgi:hypothetical protein
MLSIHLRLGLPSGLFPTNLYSLHAVMEVESITESYQYLTN